MILKIYEAILKRRDPNSSMVMRSYPDKKCGCCGEIGECFRLPVRKYICIQCAAEANGMTELEFSLRRQR